MAQAITDIDLETEFGDRFSFWTGASGKRYIHSVYAAGDCPPLPGAIYLQVAVTAQGERVALTAGRFSPFWDATLLNTPRQPATVTEIHVHLLSSSEAEAMQVLSDLRDGLGLNEATAQCQGTPPPSNGKPCKQREPRGFTDTPALPLFDGLAA